MSQPTKQQQLDEEVNALLQDLKANHAPEVRRALLFKMLDEEKLAADAPALSGASPEAGSGIRVARRGVTGAVSHLPSGHLPRSLGPCPVS